MIWRLSFVALLIGSLLVACSNRLEQQPCPLTKNKALSASRVTAETYPNTPRTC